MTHLPSSTGNAAGGVSVAHVVDVAQKLQFVIQSRDDSVNTVGDEGDLLLVVGVSGQSVDSDIGELGEEFLDAGSILEEPGSNKQNFTNKSQNNNDRSHSLIILDEDVGDQSVATSADIFPSSLHIKNLVTRQFGLGINQIFGFPLS